MFVLSVAVVAAAGPPVLSPEPPLREHRGAAPNEKVVQAILKASLGTKLTIVPLKETSTFRDSGHQIWRDRIYRAANCFDRDYRTAWVDGRRGDGIGEWVEASFVMPTVDGRGVIAQAFLIVPGFAKNRFMFRKNNRPERLRAELRCEAAGMVPVTLRHRLALADTRRPQLFVIPAAERVPVAGACTFRLTVEKIYRGTHFPDTSIAEARIVCRRQFP